MINDKISRENFKRYGSLCLLIREAGGTVYQQSRLANAVYALSEGRVDDTFLEKIFPYKFNGLDIAGPMDRMLQEDLNLLLDHGYINIEFKKTGSDKDLHHVITLLKRGNETADLAKIVLSAREFRDIQIVAKDLKSSDIKAVHLINKYCPRWQEAAVKILAAI